LEKLLNKILLDTKLAYKESVLINNKFLEDKLLSSITELKLLEKELEKNKIFKRSKYKSEEELENNEIEKVKRRIILWNNKQNQMNYKILKAFMDLSNDGNHSVNIISLERYLNIKDPRKFLGHYNQLKTISAKNHGKVFHEENGQISLWKPVEEFIIENFSR